MRSLLQAERVERDRAIQQVVLIKDQQIQQLKNNCQSAKNEVDMLIKVLQTAVIPRKTKLAVDLFKGTAEQALQAQFNQLPVLRQNTDLLRVFLMKPNHMTFDQFRPIVKQHSSTVSEIHRVLDILNWFPDLHADILPKLTTLSTLNKGQVEDLRLKLLPKDSKGH